MIGNEEGTGDTSTLNPAPLGPPKNPSRNGYTPPTHRYNPKPIPQKENLSTISYGHPHSCLKTHKSEVSAQSWRGQIVTVDGEVLRAHQQDRSIVLCHG